MTWKTQFYEYVLFDSDICVYANFYTKAWTATSDRTFDQICYFVSIATMPCWLVAHILKSQWFKILNNITSCYPAISCLVRLCMLHQVRTQHCYGKYLKVSTWALAEQHACDIYFFNDLPVKLRVYNKKKDRKFFRAARVRCSTIIALGLKFDWQLWIPNRIRVLAICSLSMAACSLPYMWSTLWLQI